MKTYTVTARRWARGWEVEVDGVGITSARRLNEVRYMATDYIEIMTGETSDKVDINLIVQLGGELDTEVTEVRTAAAEAREAQECAARRSRQVAHRLRDGGLTGVEVATVLGVSPSRVSQLLREPA